MQSARLLLQALRVRVRVRVGVGVGVRVRVRVRVKVRVRVRVRVGVRIRVGVRASAPSAKPRRPVKRADSMLHCESISRKSSYVRSPLWSWLYCVNTPSTWVGSGLG